MLFDSFAPARLTLRANLWLLYLKGPAFSIVVKSSRLALWAFGFQQVIQEEGVPLEVTGGEAAGFGGEAVGPCEACALHPGWGVGFGAGIDIEGEADCEKDAAGEEGFESLEEVVLLGCAETDPEEIGAQGLKVLDDFGIVFQCAFGGAISMVGSNDMELRICFEQVLAEFFSALWTAAEEVV